MSNLQKFKIRCREPGPFSASGCSFHFNLVFLFDDHLLPVLKLTGKSSEHLPLDRILV